MTLPYKDILSREFPHDSSELELISKVLEEFVNFGTKIIEWDIQQLTGEEELIVPLLFLRSYLDKVDAISILVKSSSIEPCKVLLRTSLETAFYLEYLLQTNTLDRSLAYLFWSRKRQNTLLQKFDSDSQHNKNYKATHSKDKLVKDTSEISLKNAKERLNLSNSILNSDKYKHIKTEYDSLKKPYWYSLFNGPANLEELARNLSLNTFYDLLYRIWSDATHGTDVFFGKVNFSTNKQLMISDIRDSKLVFKMTSNCLSICTIVFNTYIAKKLPNKKNEFDSWLISVNDSVNSIQNKNKSSNQPNL